MDERTRRVLLTGHGGYIGRVMSRELAAAGFEVAGLDTGFFEECNLYAEPDAIPSLRKDIRDLVPQDLKGHEAVVHLAALSNDPIGNLNSVWTEDINVRASVRLAELARESGVRRFLFSSSCIMYGMAGEDTAMSEESPLDPRTDYARSKVESERAIAALAASEFSPVFLRNGTVYGLSPRMRFDTVFNSLMGAAVATGEVVVQSDGKPWRPVVHVQDVARAFVRVLQARREDIHNQAFNTGSESLNYEVIQLAEAAVAAVPGCRLRVASSPGADQRTYRTDFAKFMRTFPDFIFRWTPTEGARELRDAFRRVGLTRAQFDDPRFTRLKWLKHLLEKGLLDNSLRWKEVRKATA